MVSKERTEWHLDRRVTLALIGTLLLQAMMTGWWAASMDGRVTVNEQRIATNTRHIEEGRREMGNVGRDLARIGANIETLVEQVRQMNQRLNGREDREK